MPAEISPTIASREARISRSRSRCCCSCASRSGVRSWMKPRNCGVAPLRSTPTERKIGKDVPPLRCAATLRPRPITCGTPLSRYRAMCSSCRAPRSRTVFLAGTHFPPLAGPITVSSLPRLWRGFRTYLPQSHERPFRRRLRRLMFGGAWRLLLGRNAANQVNSGRSRARGRPIGTHEQGGRPCEVARRKGGALPV
jgi:hypothetical protein